MSNLRPTLILQPIHNSSADILKRFALSKPLTCEQTDFLDWHQNLLSSREFDPVIQYYLKTNKAHQNRFQPSFLLPHEEINVEAIKELKQRLGLTLKQKSSHAVIRLTYKQYLQFKDYTIKELIYWHGASFYPGGIPYVLYFQWGTLFGVVKPSLLAEENALRANILVYFEDMQDRQLNQCVLDYNYQFENDIELQNKHFYENKLVFKHENDIKLQNNHSHENQFAPPQPVMPSRFKTPELKLTNYFLLDHLVE